MEIITERLVMRRFRPQDFEDWYPLDQDPRVMKYIWQCKPKPASRDEAMALLGQMIDYYDNHQGLGVFATCLKGDGRLIGWTALKDLDGTELTEIGYRYFFDHWGRGYATEAAAALKDHGFNNVGLRKISAVTHPENSASKGVLGKLGFRFIREDVFYDTKVHYYEIHAGVAG